jgi:hypothetical protein
MAANRVTLATWVRQHVLVVCIALSFGAGTVTLLTLNKVLTAPQNVPMLGGTLQGMRSSLAVLNHGGPPLLGVFPPGPQNSKHPSQVPLGLSGFRTRKAAGPGKAQDAIPGLPGTPYAVGVGSDQGMFLFVPLLGHWLGISSVRSVMRYLYLALAVLAASLYPVLFFRIFRSLWASAIAPLGLLYVLVRVVPLVDVYWVPALLLLLAVPLLFALRSASSATVVGGFAAVALLASISDSVRAYTGVGLFVAALIAAIRWLRGRRKRYLAIGLIALSFLSIYPLGLTAVRAYRNSKVAIPRPAIASTHPFWHPMYLGLGYIQPNRFGLVFSDPYGMATAVIYDPRVNYATAPYEKDLEHAFASIVASDPGYVLLDYAEKAGDVMGSAIRYFWPGLIALVVAFVSGRRDRRWRELSAMFLPIVGVVGLAPLVAIPLAQYEEPWWSMAGLACLFGVSGLAGTISAGLRSVLEGQSLEWRLVVHLRKRLSATKLTCRVVLCVVAIGAGIELVHAAKIWDARATYAADSTPTQPLAALQLGRPVVTWSFTGRTSVPWVAYAGAKFQSSEAGAIVTTGVGTYNYSLASPTIALPRGDYEVSIRGEVRSGGLSLGVLDLAHNIWLGSVADFWYGQVQDRDTVMVLDITAKERVPVRVVLSNFAPDGGSSMWELSAVTLAVRQ